MLVRLNVACGWQPVTISCYAANGDLSYRKLVPGDHIHKIVGVDFLDKKGGSS